MSSQRGNIKKQGPPKHQNKFAFKFDLHDATPKTKLIKTVELHGLCQRCKEVIDWKIKYKKYKPLTVPKKCTKCSLKAIKQAYYTMCVPCATANHVCAKCGEKSDVISKSKPSPAEQMSHDSQLQVELQMLPERKRRTYNRLKSQGLLDEVSINQETLAKLKLSSLDDEEDEDSIPDSDCDDSEDDSNNTEPQTVDKSREIS